MSENNSQPKAANGKSAFVDQNICIGCSLCTQLAPQTFAMEDTGFAKASGPHTDSVEAIDSAIASCPVQCISWQES